MRLIASCTWTVGVLLSAGSLAAQVPTRTLSKPVTEFAEPFSQVAGVRELKDGRVLVVDRRDKLVQLVNLTTNTAQKVGREGSGPGEYGLPNALFALPGDTSAVFDPLNQRYLMVHPDGKPGATFRAEPAAASSVRPQQGVRPEAPQAMVMSGLGIGMPRATDAQGRIYFEGNGISMGPNGPTSADTAPIVRFDRAKRVADTLAWIRLPKAAISTSGSGSGGNQRMEVRIGGRTPYPARDAWTVLPNGTVAIARVSDYHLDLVSPMKQVTKAAAVPFVAVPVGNAEKQEYRDASKNVTALAIMRTDDGRGSQTTASTKAPPFAEPATWPSTKPPFNSDGVLAAPNGEIWVARTRQASDPIPTYDIFSAAGKLIGKAVLPKQTRVVGFGAGGAVYTLRVDDDDLQYLQRFRG